MSYKENYVSLQKQYQNPNTLMYKKLRFVDSYINSGGFLLDIGMGTGELIELEKNKFERICGIDSDEESISICRKRFKKQGNINLIQGNIGDLKKIFQNNKFNCITCLDVLEHINTEECRNAIQNIYFLLKEDGQFIFAGPGIFEKIRIVLKQSPTHIQSHSPYGWKKLFENAGFQSIQIETVDFPFIHSNFLRRRFPVFGKCCIILSKKKS